MTRLKRITNKIFGNTASTTGSPDTGAEIGQFGSAKAGTYNATADVETIQALPAYEQGWIGAVIPDQQYPTLPEMTGVNKVLSYQTGYLMQEGIPEWDSGTTYYKNSIVKYATVTTTQTTTASIGASTGITSASVNKNTFVSQISVDGNYTFTYNGTSWLYNGIATDLNIYGITYTGTPAENDAITVTLTTTTSIGNLVLYKSLTDDNTGNNPTDKNSIHWEVLNLGGGSGLENKITNCILEAPNGVATYSGTTITVKSGLKVLIPDGRNADGTLKNIEYTLTEDKTITVDKRAYYGIINYNYETDKLGYIWIDHLLSGLDSDKPATVKDTPAVAYYAIDTNKWYVTVGSTTANWQERKFIFLAQFLNTSGTITEFRSFEVLDLLKRNDKSEISGWGMPSSKYIDLTLGTSGSTYTAPANGWFILVKGAGTAQYIWFYNETTLVELSLFSPTTGTNLRAYFPCKKNDIVNIKYTASGTVGKFIFVYAEGEI